MSLPIKLISTDFDGTLFAEFEDPPVPHKLQRLLGQLQEQGAKWVINTGRDLSSLLEALARARLSVKPDYLVLVEREIFFHKGADYVEVAEWNQACTRAHAELFRRVRGDIPALAAWVHNHFSVTIYEDSFSPFCFIAERLQDADRIHEYLNSYCERIPHLTVVRNDVYARFSHEAYNKGTALAEVGRRLGILPEHTMSAGDHLNDLPMLSRTFAHWLVAPHNAIDAVKATVRSQSGFVSAFSHGHGIADGLEHFLELKTKQVPPNK